MYSSAARRPANIGRKVIRHTLQLLTAIVSSRVFSDSNRWWLYRALGYRVSRSRLEYGISFGSRNVVIGESAFVNIDVLFEGAGSIMIGSSAQVSSRVQILTSTHEIGDRVQRAGSFRQLDVEIGPGAWVGAGAVILPGVRVGRGAVVAAGSVVIADVDPDTLVAGVPAVLRRKLS